MNQPLVWFPKLGGFASGKPKSRHRDSGDQQLGTDGKSYSLLSLFFLSPGTVPGKKEVGGCRKLRELSREGEEVQGPGQSGRLCGCRVLEYVSRHEQVRSPIPRAGTGGQKTVNRWYLTQRNVLPLGRPN